MMKERERERERALLCNKVTPRAGISTYGRYALRKKVSAACSPVVELGWAI